MFLKSLSINNGPEIIREIFFKKGLNLIVDETKSETRQDSGNNVGKTTVLRLIDFCLGGKGENVYRDPEFKNKTNTEVENFLKEQNIIISLVLKRDIDDSTSPEIVINKNFLSHSQKIQEINGEYYNNKDFDKKLKELIFESDSEKPTFRQIIAKNIRYEKNRLENTIKVLHNSNTFEEYESLYFFWLGIDTDHASRKLKLQTEKSTEEAIIKGLKRNGSMSEINQALSVIERDIENLNKQKSIFNVNKNFEEDLTKLNETNAKLNILSTKINQLSLRKDLILESKNELEKEHANIDIDLLKDIYESAHSFMPNLHKKFSEMVSFHNKMLNEKIKFVTNELPSIVKEIEFLNIELRKEIAAENELSAKLKKSGAIEELEKIVTNLNLKHEQKGKYEEQQRQWQHSEEKLKNIEDELKSINEGIASQDKLIENRVKSFNKYFSKISEELYGEQFILSPDKNDRAYLLKISSIGGNLGTGKKKGEIAAFDIAYIQFCDENHIPCLHFILHDQIENIDGNQLSAIKDIVSNTNVQFVVPVLRDKLPPDIAPELYQVISLSQNDKLFKLK